MNPFVWSVPTRIRFGVGEVENLGEEALALGIRRPLLVADPTLEGAIGLISSVTKLMRRQGLEVTAWTGIQRRPHLETLKAAIEVARNSQCDGVVGVGGGSTLDVAKSVGAFWGAAESDPADFTWESARAEVQFVPPALQPVLLVPTCPGTGAELSASAAFRNAAGKTVMLYGRGLQASAVVVDPFLTLTVPSEVIGAAAVEMLVRIIDSYLTGAPDTAPQDRVSEALLQVLWESAPRAVTDSFDLEPRTQLTWISTMGRLELHVEGRQPAHFPLWFTQTAVSDRLNESKGRVLAAILWVAGRSDRNS